MFDDYDILISFLYYYELTFISLNIAFHFMDKMDLKPKFAQKIFEGEGGEYHSWSSKDFPLLPENKIGGGVLLLNPRGFALPHYADCSKIGFVLQGNDGVVGMVFPKATKEVVVKLKEGDIIPVPLGSLSWWFNQGDNNSNLKIVFLGKTNDAHIPGEFTYFLQTGRLGVLAGFSNDFISQAFGLTSDETDTMANSQDGSLIITVPKDKTLPKPHHGNGDPITKEMVHNIDSSFPHGLRVEKESTGAWTTLTQAEFPFLEKVGLSTSLIELGANTMSSPIYTTDSSAKMIYVVSGSGRVQIVGINGKRVLDAEVEAGHLVVVPRFFVVAAIAGEQGLVCLSVITSSLPILEDIASNQSSFAALSEEVLQVSLNVKADFAELVKSKIRKSSLILASKHN
ncbi:cocosin 1-like [Humulus lupulus]|uniref:cocosin 1-like n=1 Tax=Humulus lupulus TaxID=3486 RepID=UPI002B40F369|nr:cocosin 1-like [Humulus lupulus]